MNNMQLFYGYIIALSNKDELQRKISVCISAQLKNCPKIDVTRNFWLNSLYSNWLCYRLQTLAVGRAARKWVLHPVVAPIRDQKTASKCTKNYYFGYIKIIFWGGGGTDPSPAPPPHRRIAPF